MRATQKITRSEVCGNAIRTFEGDSLHFEDMSNSAAILVDNEGFIVFVNRDLMTGDSEGSASNGEVTAAISQMGELSRTLEATLSVIESLKDEDMCKLMHLHFIREIQRKQDDFKKEFDRIAKEGKKSED